MKWMTPAGLMVAVLVGCVGDTKDPIDTGDTGTDTDTDTDTDTPPVDADGDGVFSVDDCDDNDAAVYPGADEVCDDKDNDCDGTVDGPDSVDAVVQYADADADGFGDAAVLATDCTVMSGFVENLDDCDDTNKSINPDATEVCDEADVDEDCDGLIDDGDDSVDLKTGTPYFADKDGDGYGDVDNMVVSCDPVSGLVLDSTDCDDEKALIGPTCFVGFDGTFGKTWETLASGDDALYSLQSFHRLDEGAIFNMYPQVGYSYDIATNSWSTIASGPFARVWYQLAPYDGMLYGMAYNDIHSYDPATNTWTELAAFTGTDDYAMTESDENGMIYSYNDEGELITYDALKGTVSYEDLGLGDLYETRIAYDPIDRALFLGAYYEPYLYRYDLTSGTVTEMTSIPESQLNDIFCSDRSGHIYAAGNSSGTTMWQYDIDTDAWSQLPDLPSDHGNNGTCTVSEDGYLYVGTGSGQAFYRIDLY